MVTRIYIDTNVFLDFYQAATDRLAVFQELVKRSEKVILTEQTIREFRRNRTARLSELARNIEKGSEINLFTTAVVREFPQFNEWVRARDAAKDQARSIAKQLKEWIRDETSDPVYSEFLKLSSSAMVLKTVTASVERARLRKQLGDPPTSPDRHSIGDELIWETLLEGCRSDLILVSRDRTFLDNVGLLREEFEATSNRRLILVTERLPEALSQVGEPSKEIAEAEKVIKARPIPNSGIVVGMCPRCGGCLEETGFEGSDGDEAWWLACMQCGYEGYPQ